MQPFGVVKGLEVAAAELTLSACPTLACFVIAKSDHCL